MEHKDQIGVPGDDKLYKFLNLKVYASTEWLADNQKKYRQVFEQKELSYVYAELSFINKRYEESDWSAKVQLKCFLLDEVKKEICSLDLERNVSMHDHIGYIREGWGQKGAGTFWKKGKYCWEAYVNDRKLATQFFYVEDLHHEFDDWEHKALLVEQAEFFEGNYDINNEDDHRKYFVEFPESESRYIFLELNMINRYEKADWTAELFIRYYNQSRELKGQVVRLQKIKKGEKEVQVTAGWGSNVKGSWRKGTYFVEVIFMDTVLTRSTFQIGTSYREGDNDFEIPQTKIKGKKVDAEILPVNQAYQKLHSLVGLKSIKSQIADHTQYIKFLQLREDFGFQDSKTISLHSMFLGNPGTGKTTVAQLLGSIYHSMGLLKKGHVHEVDRVDLIGEYIGQTAPKVKDAFLKASGGVLLIDEAYALARQREDSKDFGREVIELLVKEMSSPKCDFMVVVAGYPKQMQTFVNSNPGLRSRFKYQFDFDDYTLEELFEIAKVFCQRYEVQLSDPATDKLHKVITARYREKDHSFGNARYISQLIEKAKINLGIRVMKGIEKRDVDTDLLSMLSAQDIVPLHEVNQVIQSSLGINEQALSKAMGQLDQMIGLTHVKEKIHQLIDIVRYRLSQGDTVTGHVPMHLVLVGNPGTGKTTVARILSSIYRALGILAKGHIIETDRQGLVSGYVGQTAIKTADKIEEAMGGVLFIDEAYGLIKTGANNDFGDEAVQILLKKMEDERGRFSVIAAGYPEQMDRFLSANPGLRSRFDHTLFFEDFNQDELIEVATSFLSDRGYKPSRDAIERLSEALSIEYQQRNRDFGNARRVRQYIDEMIKQQSLRLGQEHVTKQSRYHILIKRVDVDKAIEMLDKSYQFRRGSIGF